MSSKQIGHSGRFFLYTGTYVGGKNVWQEVGKIRPTRPDRAAFRFPFRENLKGLAEWNARSVVVPRNSVDFVTASTIPSHEIPMALAEWNPDLADRKCRFS